MNDFSNIKGTLKGWTERSCEWYENASEYTGYHDRLLEAVLPLLKQSDHCCEVACGTGLLARKVAPFVASYLANDADPHAMAFLRKKAEKEKLSALSIVEGNWTEVLNGQTFDVVLASYFGIPAEQWPFLRSLAKRQLIMICPRNERWRKIRQREEYPEHDSGKIMKLETPGHIKKFFELHGIPYQSRPMDLEFGQPLADREEACQYIEYYYHLQGEDADRFIEQKCSRNDGVLYFPKTKEIEVIAADLSEAQ